MIDLTATQTLVLATCSLALAGNAAEAGEPVLHHDATAIRKAQEGIAAEMPIAQSDPHRPVYHFLPPARWMNDPNGAFFADGWYHVFYQLNPYGNTWGHMHWGHARSRDNVFWERLPVAVWPSTEKGEDHCYSGSAVQDGKGNWQLWYTSVSKVRTKDKDKGPLAWVFNGQVMLRPLDQQYVKWGKTTDDPVNHPTLPNNIDGYGWNNYIRDPTFFKADGRTFMLLGITGNKNSGGSVAPLYEAKNPELTAWTYRGTMTDYAWDCPQMLPFGNSATRARAKRWMYVTSRGAPPRYYVGTFDPDTAKFTKKEEGTLDQGRNYHTISFATDDRARHITYSWICRTKGKGWNNCFALPRVVTLSQDGHPVQVPVPELSTLRGKHLRIADLSGSKVLEARGDTVEIRAVFNGADKGSCGLRVRRSDDGARALPITYEQGALDVFGTTVNIAPQGPEKTLTLQVFLDKSIIEVFVNDGRKTVARVMYPPLEDQGIEVFTDGKAAVDVWQMKSIWKSAGE